MDPILGSKTHFHIRWPETKHLGWECFVTRNEAEARALELAQPGEAFRIEELTTPCPLRSESTAWVN